jgi:uncharacterized membrane protein YgdD (TMEM256/DUF423 family)
MIDRRLLAFAAINGAVAVGLGAFAAHGAGLQVRTLLQTGAHYQLAHAVLAAALALTNAGGLPRLAGWLAAAGGLVFALALAAIGMLSLPAMGAVAPVGGALMIAGWLLLLLAALRSPPPSS